MSDLGALALVVSQFTLYTDVCKGRRPSWNQAEPLVDAAFEALRMQGVEVATGVFGAHLLIDMEVNSPVTILVEA